MLAVGTRLGPYEILAPLGAGGMGEVYRARDTRLGRDVALKVLPGAFTKDPSRLARLEREARTVAALNHPNIVTLFSFEEANGIHFLAMELVEGQSLHQLITPGGLPVDRVLDVTIGLADALVAAHQRGVVHRDLKPANVMLTPAGCVKVLDFGLAKPVQAEAAPGATQATVDLSGIGFVIGTVPYMAPEQVRCEPVDARTDLFAFGSIAYELCTGRRPFGGATLADVSSSILRDSPEPPTSLRADLPGTLGRIVTRCLQKEPRDRYQTALELSDELRLLRKTLESGHVPPFKPTSSVVDTPSVAVLPFANRSRDQEDEYFSDGLADELLNVLTKIRGLRVAARTSSFHFKGKNATIAEVGRALNVATILDGSVRKAGNRVRISVQLVKVSDGFHLWSETYDRSLEDIFAVQDDIAQSVVKELRTTLIGQSPDSKTSGETKAEVAAAARGRGESGEAHRLLLQGRFLINRFTHQDVLHGIEYIRQALDLDPGYALAWAWLSSAYSYQAEYGWAPISEGYHRARKAAARALELEPELAEGYLALQTIQVSHDWDWKGADASCRRALELAPGNAEVLRAAGGLAGRLGRQQDAATLLRRAIGQDPLSPRSYNKLGTICRRAGMLSEAEEAFRTSLEVSPQRVATRRSLGRVLLAQGRKEEALAEVKNEPEEWARLTGLAAVLDACGRRPEADQALHELTEKYAWSSAYQIAEIHAARGETESAFEWLECAYAQRDPGLSDVKVEPDFALLHGDPRWGAFLRRMGFED
jgi:serine/threonine protein kinase/Flp pilus assembly protein TadD